MESLSQQQINDINNIDEEYIVNVEIPPEILGKLENHVSKLLKNFNFNENKADLLMTIDPRSRSLSFQYGKWSNNIKILFHVKGIENLTVLGDPETRRIPVNLKDFAIEFLTKKFSDNHRINIGLDRNQFLSFRVCSEIVNTYIVYDSNEIQAYSAEFINELLFDSSIIKWKFHTKREETLKFKKFIRVGKSKKYEIKFSLEKLDYNELLLNIKIGDVAENKIKLNIISDLNEIQNYAPIYYDIKKILSFVSLLNDSSNELFFAVDDDGHLIIEQVENNIKISGMFPISNNI
jgi:hypothetical protein